MIEMVEKEMKMWEQAMIKEKERSEDAKIYSRKLPAMLKVTGCQ